MHKITPAEFNRRINMCETAGMVGLRGSRRGDVINVLTEPATYSFLVVGPEFQLAEITSRQDPDFLEARFCLFLGSVWDDDMEIGDWDRVPMKVPEYFLKDCYPVIYVGGRFIVLPKIYEIEIGGQPFFKTTEAPDLLEGCSK